MTPGRRGVRRRRGFDGVWCGCGLACVAGGSRGDVFSVLVGQPAWQGPFVFLVLCFGHSGGELFYVFVAQRDQHWLYLLRLRTLTACSTAP